MSNQENIRREITDKIIKTIESGTPIWSQPWHTLGACENFVSHKKYRGLNILLSMIHRHEFGLKSNLYGTFCQIKSIDCKLKKGSKGCHIVFFSPYKVTTTDANGETHDKTFPLLRTFTVFNLDQVDGKKADELRMGQEKAIADRLANPIKHEIADSVLDKSGIKIVYGGSECYYRPSNDTVYLPVREDFKSLEGFFNCAFHELAHATSSSERCNRVTKWSRFGSEAYACEELSAELTAVYLSNALGIGYAETKPNAAYIASWLNVLNNDTKLIFQAASAASLASDYLLNKAGILESKILDEASVTI